MTALHSPFPPNQTLITISMWRPESPLSFAYCTHYKIHTSNPYTHTITIKEKESQRLEHNTSRRWAHRCLNPSSLSLSLLSFSVLTWPRPWNQNRIFCCIFSFPFFSVGGFIFCRGKMYSAIHSLPLDGSGGHGEFQGGSLDGTNLPGDASLVLTTDPKPRLRWTAELHERFVDAVTQLGGPDSVYKLSIFIYLCIFMYAFI